MGSGTEGGADADDGGECADPIRTRLSTSVNHRFFTTIGSEVSFGFNYGRGFDTTDR